MFEILSDVLRSFSDAMKIPVIIVLLLLMAIVVVQLGYLVAEIFTERRHLKVKMPILVDKLKAGEEPIETTINESGLLKRQKKALLELTNHKEITATMRESLAVRMIYEEKNRYDKLVKVTDIVAKLAPMFGLLGTLIPLGPGIMALGRGDTSTLSSSLLTAFDTTIAGIIIAAVAMIISAIRKNWYNNYMSALEAAMEVVLEVEKDND